MRALLFAAAVCLSLTSTVAHAQCVEVDRISAIWATTNYQIRTELAQARAALPSPANPAQFAAGLTAGISAMTKLRNSLDQSAALLRRAIGRGCVSAGTPFTQQVAQYRALSRLYSEDIRVYRQLRAEVLHPKWGPGSHDKVMALLCERAKIARSGIAAVPARCA